MTDRIMFTCKLLEDGQPALDSLVDLTEYFLPADPLERAVREAVRVAVDAGLVERGGRR